MFPTKWLKSSTGVMANFKTDKELTVDLQILKTNILKYQVIRWYKSHTITSLTHVFPVKRLNESSSWF